MDVWRGIACLAVVAFHAAHYAPHIPLREGGLGDKVLALLGLGWAGVPIFFVISGYCIAATADAARRKPMGVRDYAWRRFRRIYPPYWAAVIFMAVMVELTGCLLAEGDPPMDRPGELSAVEWLGNLTLTESWRFHIVGPTRRYFLGPAWTLCYEEQFYFVVGLLIWLAPRRLFPGVAAVTAASLVAPHLGLDIEGFFIDDHWLSFACGVAVYWRLNHAGPKGARAIDLVLIAAFLWATFGPGELARIASTPRGRLLFAASFARILVALRGLDDRLADARVLRPLAWCGTRCYSLYLIHWPITKAVGRGLELAGVRGTWGVLSVSVPACVVASLAVAWVFFALVEERFLAHGASRRDAETNRKRDTAIGVQGALDGA